MPDDPPSHASAINQVRREQEKRPRWVAPVFVVMVVLILLAFFGGKAALTGTKNAYGRYLAGKAAALMQEERWESASKILNDACAHAPDEPDVMRTTAKFLRDTGGDPGTVLYFLKRLNVLDVATTDDNIRYAETLMLVGEVTQARTIYDNLPDSVRNERRGLELLSKLLDEEGRKTEALETLRRGLLLEPENPECKLRLAILDIDQPFDETRRKARAAIWSLARQHDATALQAMSYLASSKELSPGEAQELVEVSAAHPKISDSQKFTILSAYMRLFPTERDAILTRECERFRGKGIDEVVRLLRWLSAENQHDKILSIVSRDVVLKSPDAFPSYADALIATKKFAELRDIIHARPAPPVTEAAANAYLAQCYSQLEPDYIQTRHFIENAYRAATKSGELAILLKSAQIAESLGLLELAEQGYLLVAEKNARARVIVLNKVYDIAATRKAGDVMLDIATRITAERPDSDVYRLRVDYLHLLLGRGFEQACESMLSAAQTSSANETSRALVRALAAYRIGDLTRTAAALRQVSEPQKMEPGHRAVFAGLTRITGGDATSAFKLAETVPSSILLEEELAFLRHAF